MKSKEMASTGDIWVQWFTCCFHQPQSPTRRRQRHQRMRIDRSMIGHPTNFVHTGKYINNILSNCLTIEILFQLNICILFECFFQATLVRMILNSLQIT